MIQQATEVNALRERVKFLTSEIQRLQRVVDKQPDLREIRAKVWEQAAQEFHQTRIGSSPFSTVCMNKAKAIREGKDV